MLFVWETVKSHRLLVAQDVHTDVGEWPGLYRVLFVKLKSTSNTALVNSSHMYYTILYKCHVQPSCMTSMQGARG